MKKFLMLAVAASLSAFVLAGCGEDKKPQESESTAAGQESAAAEETEPEKVYPEDAYVDNLNASDYVTLGDYLGVKVEMEKPSVTDEDVDNYIDYVRSSNKVKNEVAGRAVKDGDVVDINYEGKKDGVAFEGGAAENFELGIGSNSFIDGFEDGIIGMNAGETKDLNLTFPDPYKNNEELSGAAVVFTVTVNKIYEETLPELNDEFVSGLGIEDVADVEAYRKYVSDNLMKSVQSQYDMAVESAVLQAVHANAEFKEVPEALVERYYDRVVSNMTYEAGMYGIDLTTFMAMRYQMTEEQYPEEMRLSAKQAAEQVIALTAIAEKEGMTVTDEDIEKDLEAKAAEYGYESKDAFKEAIGAEIKGYRETLTTERIAEYLVKNAKVTEPEKTVSGNGTETESETDEAQKEQSEPAEETETGKETEAAKAD